MPKPIYTFYDESAVNPCKSRSAFHAAKLQLFHKPARGWRKFYYDELPLVGCFTRITINVPRIVINCFGVLYLGADGSSSHVTPLVFSFSNRKDPNFAQTFQMIRMGSVRDCFSVAPATMSCRCWLARWRASMVAANWNLPFSI